MPSPTAPAGTADLSALFAPAIMTEQTREHMYGIACELAGRYQDSADAYPWVVAFSGGKDSPCLRTEVPCGRGQDPGCSSRKALGQQECDPAGSAMLAAKA